MRSTVLKERNALSTRLSKSQPWIKAPGISIRFAFPVFSDISMRDMETHDKKNAALETDMRSQLTTLKRRLPALASGLALSGKDRLTEWERIVDTRLLPLLSPNFPLTVMIMGGGSAGKSTLFNTLCRKRISPAGGRAGINRRILAAAHPDRVTDPAFFGDLKTRFQTGFEKLVHEDELTTPGPPLLSSVTTIPPTMMFLDTPDFDTGAKGTFENREAVEPFLAAADVLVYIFTNATYNNLGNTDFAGRQMGKNSRRPGILVYRVPVEFTDEEVRAHTNTVARHLFGDDTAPSLLGVYRADEDNAVAVGEKRMTLSPVRPFQSSLMESLAGVDVKKARLTAGRAALSNTLETARWYQNHATDSLSRLDLYQNAAQILESNAVQSAAAGFPMDKLLRRFARIWMAGDPSHIKVMRRTGKVLDIPVKAVWRVGGFIRRMLSDAPPPPPNPPENKVKTGLVSSANQLRAGLTAPGVELVLDPSNPVARKMCATADVLSERNQRQTESAASPMPSYIYKQGEGIFFTLRAHPAMTPAQKALANRPWRPVLDAVMARESDLSMLSPKVDRELQRIAEKMRDELGVWGQARETASAALNILPATAAVTYILTTGDPVGAAGIKVKLAGLFGLHDLYALVALPASSGMKAADRGQLAQILGPVAAVWLNDRLAAVRDLFQTHLTEDFFAEMDRIKFRAKADLSAANDAANQLELFTTNRNHKP